MIVSGRARSGKTTQAVEMIRLLRRHRHWDYIYLVCPTHEQDTYDPIRKYITQTYQRVDAEEGFNEEDVFMRLHKRVTRHAENGEKTLIIIDDCSGEQATNTGRKGGLPRMANNARWLKLSLVVITQNLSSITPSLRENAEALVMFNTLNVKEREYLYKERNPFGTVSELEAIYLAATRAPHDFYCQVITNQGVLHFHNFTDTV